MIYNLNEMSSLTEEFLISYYTVFPFTYRMFLKHAVIRGGICGEKELLFLFYDYKKQSREELPHYNISDVYNEKELDLTQVKITDCR